MKTRDGYEIEVGMWIEDVNGLYEVKEIHEADNLVTVNLIEIGDDMESQTIDTLTKTKEEVTKCRCV